jgi:transcriptional regulator with XRE-family HTH domain
VVANTTNERERLASLLRAIRVAAGLRQIDLAERLNQPQSYVSRFESGEQRLDLIELKAIAEALGITLTDIIQRFEKE